MMVSVRRTVAAVAASLALTLPASAQQATPPAPPPPTLTVGVVGYGLYLYQLKDTTNHQNNFDVGRAYLNAILRSGTVLGRITVDIFNGGTAASAHAYRLKYAYAAWTPAKSPLTYKLGAIHTPWVDWEEALWDYRVQGTMPVERNGYATSSDFGAGVDGMWNKDQVNAQLAFVNGEGYGGGVGDKRKDLEARVSVRVMNTDDASRVGGLRLSAYGQVGAPTTGGVRQRFIGMASYRSKALTLAAEYAATTDSITGGARIPGQLISAYGVYKVPKSRVGFIARVDHVKPNTRTASTIAGVSNTRVIAGLSCQVNPNLRVMGDVDLLNYQNGSPSAAAEAVRQTIYTHVQFNF